MRKTLYIVIASLILLCAWSVSGVFAQSGTGRPFITKWQGTKGEELKIPIVGTYKMVIKDGSGNEKVNETVTVEDAEHPYVFTPTEDGTYTVAAGPEGVKYMQMRMSSDWNPLTSNDRLLEVVQFGTVKWESMEEMFNGCKKMTFAEGIDTPDLSEVTNMAWMFCGCKAFDQPLNEWNVSNVTDMEGMFSGCYFFNQSLNNWDVSKVTNMEAMFIGCQEFNQPLNSWNVGNVTNMIGMFMDCWDFNQPLNGWNVSNVTDMSKMFKACTTFNQSLNNWNVGKITNMEGMFSECHAFNQPLENWDVSNVTNMEDMFELCDDFNQPLDHWDVSNVWNMRGMFYGCSSFNQPLDHWNVSNVSYMVGMFMSCFAFNQPLNNWNVSKVQDMTYMFADCRSFNQPLDNWDVSYVSEMMKMFEGCSSFNQPLGSWKIRTVVGGLNETAISPSNYSQTLMGWAEQTDITEDLNFEDNVKGLVYNDQGKAAQEKLMDKGWRFYDDIHQPNGVSITPRSLLLVLNKECTLPLEKWGVEETENVKLSTDRFWDIISYELTEDKKGVHIKGLKKGKCKLTATIAAKKGVHKAYTSTCEIEVYIR